MRNFPPPESLYEVAEVKKVMVEKALLLDKKKTQSPLLIRKAVEGKVVLLAVVLFLQNLSKHTGYVYRDNIQEYVSQAAAANFNQGNTGYRAPISNQIRPPVGFSSCSITRIMCKIKEQSESLNKPRELFQSSSSLPIPRFIKVKIFRPHVGQPHVISYRLSKLQLSDSRCMTGRFPSLRYVAVMRKTCKLKSKHAKFYWTMTDMLSNFITSNTASLLGNTLPSHTVTNQKRIFKGSDSFLPIEDDPNFTGVDPTDFDPDGT
ncbi:hypothetical protein Tco_0236246 [Tanacetum coccineum]|uniref:Uncharacterized protein n=1 Tax=Tanacetum coccineum TaxID=301880 RepID=A0ABQ5HET8_9ASTR